MEEFKDESVGKGTLEERRKERQECLDMLKRELKRIQDGGDPYDLRHLLGEEEKRLLDGDDDEDDDETKGKDELESEKQEDDLHESEKLINSKEELSEPKKIK